jgi:hypothetical protein
VLHNKELRKRGLYGPNRNEVDNYGHYITRKFLILIGHFVIVVTTVNTMTLQSIAHVYRIGERRNTHKILVVIPLQNTREIRYWKLGKIT